MNFDPTKPFPAFNGSQSEEQNVSPTRRETREEMNERIKGIARGIVDKWKAEGLTVTRDKVEGWLGTLEKSRKSAQQQAAKPSSDNTEKFGSHFPQVRDHLVDTFSKIGKVKCPNCDKSKTSNQLENDDKKLEQLSLEELLAKQKAIQQFAQMSKNTQMAKPKENKKLEELSVDELIEKQKVIQQFAQMSKSVKGEQPKDSEDVKLEQLSVEQLIQKQKAIQQFSQMGKMAKLVSNLNKLTTPREEL